VRPEGLCQWKILKTPSWIGPATFWLITQCLKQLRHPVPLGSSRTSGYLYQSSRRHFLKANAQRSLLPFPWVIFIWSILFYWFLAANSIGRAVKLYVSGLSLAGFTASNTDGAWMCLSHIIAVCCQVEVSVTGRSLVQRSPTDCVSPSVIRYNNNPLHLQWVGRKGQVKVFWLLTFLCNNDLDTLTCFVLSLSVKTQCVSRDSYRPLINGWRGEIRKAWF
jgi:hypothetical protein